jgi:hypothetical protein
MLTKLAAVACLVTAQVAGEGAVKEREQGLGIELDGLLGSGLLATFRVTLIDGGRAMWLEDLPREALVAPPIMSMPDDVDLPLDEEDEAEEEPVQKKPTGKGKPATPPAQKPKAGINQKP